MNFDKFYYGRYYWNIPSLGISSTMPSETKEEAIADALYSVKGREYDKILILKPVKGTNREMDIVDIL